MNMFLKVLEVLLEIEMYLLNSISELFLSILNLNISYFRPLILELLF